MVAAAGYENEGAHPAVRDHNLVAPGANRVVAGLRLERRGRVLGISVVRRAALGDPALARTVEQSDVAVTVVREVPVGVGGEPVIAVAVEDDQVVVETPRLPNSRPKSSARRRSRRTGS